MTDTALGETCDRNERLLNDYGTGTVALGVDRLWPRSSTGRIAGCGILLTFALARMRPWTCLGACSFPREVSAAPAVSRRTSPRPLRPSR